MEQEFRINDMVGVIKLNNTEEYEILDGCGHIVDFWFDNALNQYVYKIEFIDDGITEIPSETVYPANRLRMSRAIFNHEGQWYMFRSNTDCLEAMDRLDNGEELTGWIKTGDISSNMDEYAKNIYVAGLDLSK